MSINKIILIGNVGTIETRHTSAGDPIVNLSLACSESWKDKNTGQKQEKTTWVRCVLFGFPAKITSEYAGKGSKLYLEGKWVNREWEKEGVKQYSTECHIDGFNGKVELLTPKSAGQNKPSGAPAQQQATTIPNPDEFEDSLDIPF